MYKTSSLWSSFSMKVFCSLLIILFAASPSMSSAAQICSAGKFVTDQAEDTRLSPDSISRAEKALEWIYSMMEIHSSFTENKRLEGTITPDAPYGYGHVESVSGVFDISGLNPVVGDTSGLDVTSPQGQIPDSYRSIVSGVVTPSLAGTHEVRAFLKSDQHYDQSFFVTPSVINPGTGAWSLNLSSLPIHFGGSLEFGVFEIGPTSGDTTEETQVGTYWPHPYRDYEFEYYALTDDSYLTATTSALSNDTWSFEESYLGVKYIALKDKRTDEVVAEYLGPSSGLVRSFELEPGDAGYGTSFEQRSYMYDQALALVVASENGDDEQAHTLLQGLLLSQRTGNTQGDTPDVIGGFPFSAPQGAPQGTDIYMRTGAHAIAVYALLKYADLYPTGPYTEQAKQGARAGISYTDGLLVREDNRQQGLYKGGTGRYLQGGESFEQDYVIPWASTEHNLDMWHTLSLAERVLGDVQYQEKADSLKEAILKQLWNPETNRFYQGVSNATTPDQADALDTNSWGAIFLSAIGEFEMAAQAMQRVELYKHTSEGVTGYAPYHPEGLYSGATPTVWFEGTYGVSLAFLRNDMYQEYLNSITQSESHQGLDGSFVYATDPVPAYEIGDFKSVASTAWYVIGTIARDAFWVECIPPTQEQIEEKISIERGSSSSGGGGGSGSEYSCRDTEALNYETRGSHDQNLCEYEQGELESDVVSSTTIIFEDTVLGEEAVYVESPNEAEEEPVLSGSVTNLVDTDNLEVPESLISQEDRFPISNFIQPVSQVAQEQEIEEKIQEENFNIEVSGSKVETSILNKIILGVLVVLGVLIIGLLIWVPVLILRKKKKGSGVNAGFGNEDVQ